MLVSKKYLTLPAERDVPWKLRSLWDGLYPVTQVLTNDEGRAFAYKLELPVHVKRAGLHDVFSVNKLVKYKDGSKWPSQKQSTIPETEMIEGQREHCVKAIRGHRTAKKPGRPKKGQSTQYERQYLVEWEGLHEGHTEWRNTEKLNRGGILRHWKEYEQALYEKDPASVSQEALKLIPSLQKGGDVEDKTKIWKHQIPHYLSASRSASQNTKRAANLTSRLPSWHQATTSKLQPWSQIQETYENPHG